MHKYTEHAMWDTVAIGHIADLNRAYMYENIWIDTSWFLMKNRDRQSNHAQRQTDRLIIIDMLSVAIGPTPTKDRDTQITQHAAISDIAVRRNTAWDALDPRNVYLNTMYFNISHTMCNLIAKSLTNPVRLELSSGRPGTASTLIR